MRPLTRKRRYVTRVPGLTEVHQVTDFEESLTRVFFLPRRDLCRTPLASVWATKAVVVVDRPDAPITQVHAAHAHTRAV